MNFFRTRQFWENFYEAEGTCWGWAPSVFARRVANILEQHSGGDHIVDLGAGYGRDSLYLAETFPVRQVHAIDFSARALAILAKKISEGPQTLTVEAIERDLAGGSSLPRKLVGTTQSLIMHSLLHNWDDATRQHILRQLAIDSGNGSRIFLSTYSDRDCKFGKGQAVDERTFRCVPRYPEVAIRFFSEDELATELHIAGWHVEELQEYREKEVIQGNVEESLYHFVIASKDG